MEAIKSPTPHEFTISGSLLVASSGVYRGSHTTVYCVAVDNPNGSEFTILPRQKKIGPVRMELAKDEFENLLSMSITKTDLPFSLMELESFRDFVYFLGDYPPNISRATMRSRLDAIYEKKFQTLNEKLNHNAGKFSTTIHAWKSGNSLDFLGITLHFYNNKFHLENHTIEFEKN